jgi:hypothetical protein
MTAELSGFLSVREGHIEDGMATTILLLTGKITGLKFEILEHRMGI